VALPPGFNPVDRLALRLAPVVVQPLFVPIAEAVIAAGRMMIPCLIDVPPLFWMLSVITEVEPVTVSWPVIVTPAVGPTPPIAPLVYARIAEPAMIAATTRSIVDMTFEIPRRLCISI
jgi:hypothetical protein